jgi:hypothetical protein
MMNSHWRIAANARGITALASYKGARKSLAIRSAEGGESGGKYLGAQSHAHHYSLSSSGSK